MKRAWQHSSFALLFVCVIAACATQSQQGQNDQQANFKDDENFGDEAEDEGFDDEGGNDAGGDDALANGGDEPKNGAEDGEFNLAAEDSGNLPYVNDSLMANGNAANGNLGINANADDGALFANGNGGNTGNALMNNAPMENAAPQDVALNQGVVNPMMNQGVPAQAANQNVPAATNVANAPVQSTPNEASGPVDSVPASNVQANGALTDLMSGTQRSGSTLKAEFLTGGGSGDESEDVGPTYAQVRWVGYDFDREGRKLRVEIVTSGNPSYEIIQERNRAGQPELVIRFYETELREKSARPLDASEFRSPVAYVRMRANDDDASADVILTLRDQAKPKLLAKDGNVRLTFDIPDYYFGNSAQDVAQRIGSAEKLALADVVPELEAESERPRRREAFVPDPGEQTFGNAPDDAGTIIQPVEAPVNEVQDPSTLPESFDEGGAIAPNAAPVNEAPMNETLPDAPLNESAPNVPNDEIINFESRREERDDAVLAAFRVERFALAAVAQDNNAGNENFEDEDVGEDGEDDANANNAANANANAGGNANVNGNGANANVNANANPNGNGNFNANANFVDDPTSFNGSLNGNAPANGVPPGNNVPLNNALPLNNAPLNNALPFNNNAPLNNAPMNNGAGNAVAPLNDGGNAMLENAPAEIEPAPESSTVAPDIAGMETEGAPQPGSGGRPISIEFHRAPLHLVLKTFGEESGNNFIYPADVANTEITIRLRQVPWDEALKAILETYGLGMVQVGQNVVRIDRLAKMNEYLKDLNTVRQYREQLEPTKILVLRLSHGTAKDVVTQMQELLKTDIEKDPRIKITADERTNSVVAEAATSTLSKIKNVLERLDLETPQVRIASRIVEVSKSATNFFGILWSNTFNFDPGRGLGLGSLPFPNSVNSDFTVDPGVSGQATSGNLTMRFGSLNRFLDLDLLLKMEERKGTTNILQNNNVLVLDRQRASILAGSSQFFRPAAGGNVITQGGNAGAPEGNGLAEVTFNLSLDVVPQVTAAGNINMKLIITSDTPGDPTGEQLATKNTRRLETMMTRRNGETAVIGGIYDTKRTKTVVGVPYLSDIPILGLLFKSTLSSDTQTELLIMVTPTLVGLADNADAAYQDGFSAAPPPPAGGDDAGELDEDEGTLEGNNGNGGNNLNAGGGNTIQAGGNGATANNNFGGNVEEANF